MSTNYHTPVVPGSAELVSTINDPLGQLDSAISQLVNGLLGFTQLNLSRGADIVTDGSGTITVTDSVHVVTYGSGNRRITTINGGAEGRLLVLLCSGVEVFGMLCLEQTAVVLLYVAGSWRLITPPTSFFQGAPLNVNSDIQARRRLGALAYNATMQAVGVVLTTSGTLGGLFEQGWPLTSFTTAATVNAVAGMITNSVNVVRSTSRARMRAVVANLGTSDSRTIYVGFTGDASGPFTSLTNFVGFTRDGSSTTWEALAGGSTNASGAHASWPTIASSTIHFLDCIWDNGTVYARVSTPTVQGQWLTLTYSPTSPPVNHGIVAQVRTSVAAARTMSLSRLLVEAL